MLSFFADEDSMQRPVIRALREAGVDIVTAADTGRRGLDDEDHLRFATDVGRVIFTSNVADFARLHHRWWVAGRVHAGLVLLVDQRTSIGIQIAALRNLSDTLDSDQMRGRLEYLASWIPKAD